MKKDMAYMEAKDLAVSICYLLQPHCEKINIAGSLRRKKETIGDIEIMVQPQTETVKIDLFENTKEVISHEFVTILNKLGKVVKGEPTGRMMQINLMQDIMLDLFMPVPADYYRQLAIRTGSRNFSQYVLAAGWLHAGWCGSDQGFRKMKDCLEIKTKTGGKFWKCINPLADLPPPWQSEKEFFEFIKIKWIHPQNRN